MLKWALTANDKFQTLNEQLLTISKMTLTETSITTTNATTIGKFPDKRHVLDIRTTEDIEATSKSVCSYNFYSISIYTEF